MAKYNELGQEIPDPTPVAMPLGYECPESLSDVVARMVKVHISKQAKEQGLETFEENDDFKIEEDEEVFTSQYQMNGMEEERLSPARIKEAKDASQKRNRIKLSRKIGSGSKELASGSGQSAEGVGKVAVGDDSAPAGDGGVKVKQ